MNFFPDFAPNSRKQWGLSLFDQFCGNELENYRIFWKFVKIIKYYSILFNRVLTDEALCLLAKLAILVQFFSKKRRLKTKPLRHFRGWLGRPDWLPGGFAGLADRFPGRSLAFAPWNRCYRSKPHYLCSKTLRLRREKESLFSLHTS